MQEVHQVHVHCSNGASTGRKCIKYTCIAVTVQVHAGSASSTTCIAIGCNYRHDMHQVQQVHMSRAAQRNMAPVASTDACGCYGAAAALATTSLPGAVWYRAKDNSSWNHQGAARLAQDRVATCHAAGIAQLRGLRAERMVIPAASTTCSAASAPRAPCDIQARPATASMPHSAPQMLVLRRCLLCPLGCLPLLWYCTCWRGSSRC
jgi:hypothetical protein